MPRAYEDLNAVLFIMYNYVRSNIYWGANSLCVVGLKSQRFLLMTMYECTSNSFAVKEYFIICERSLIVI